MLLAMSTCLCKTGWMRNGLMASTSSRVKVAISLAVVITGCWLLSANYSTISRASSGARSRMLDISRGLIGTKTDAKYLCFKTGARLGNNMFGFASVFALARERDMVPVVSTSIREVFKLSSSCDEQIDLWGQVCDKANKVSEDSTKCNAFDDRIWAIGGLHNVRIVSACLRSWKYLTGHEKEIRHEFTFRDHVKNMARQALHREIAKQGSGVGSADRVFVGIHVRRGDRLNSMSFIVPGQTYFRKAMSFMRDKYQHVMFVVCSEDMPWSKSNLYSTDTIFVETGTAEGDLAVLSMCNHTIMSVGTFGWWAGWLVNGTTVYYRRPFAQGFPGDAHTTMSEYMPPHWISMG